MGEAEIITYKVLEYDLRSREIGMATNLMASMNGAALAIEREMAGAAYCNP